jgi:hypothetical protein
MELNGRPFVGEDPDTVTPLVERVAAGDATTPEIITWLEQRPPS